MRDGLLRAWQASRSRIAGASGDGGSTRSSGRSRGSGSPGRSTHVLTVPGRESGRLWSTPVSIVRDGDERWLVAPYGERNWVKNARAAGWVELRRGRRRERLAVEEVDAEHAVPVLREYYRRFRVTRPFFEVTLESSHDEWLAEASAPSGVPAAQPVAYER